MDIALHGEAAPAVLALIAASPRPAAAVAASLPPLADAAGILSGLRAAGLAEEAGGTWAATEGGRRRTGRDGDSTWAFLPVVFDEGGIPWAQGVVVSRAVPGVPDFRHFRRLRALAGRLGAGGLAGAEARAPTDSLPPRVSAVVAGVSRDDLLRALSVVAAELSRGGAEIHADADERALGGNGAAPGKPSPEQARRIGAVASARLRGLGVVEADLARALGMTRQSLNKRIRHPSRHGLSWLERVLGVPAPVLLSGDPGPAASFPVPAALAPLVEAARRVPVGSGGGGSPTDPRAVPLLPGSPCPPRASETSTAT